MRISSPKFFIPCASLALVGVIGAFTALAVDDTTPPSAVSDLTVATATPTTVGLAWTAPGDDGVAGTAASYDVRYRTSGFIDDVNFATSTAVAGEPSPAVAGAAESFTVTGLSPTTTYWFALRATDDAGNTSGLSNVVSTTTPADTAAPVISGVIVTDITTNSAKVKWMTDEIASSLVEYGTTASYGLNASSTGMLMSHAVPLSGLTPSTTYHFLVSSSDAFGNTATSTDRTFLTLATSTPPITTTTIQARLQMDPRTINRVRKGKKITAVVRLPKGVTFEGLDTESVLLNGSVKPIDLKLRKREWNHWGRVRRTLTMKFNSDDILPLIPTSTDQFVFTVTGKVKAGTFTGSDTVRIMPKVPKPKPNPSPKIEKKMEKIEERMEEVKERLEERREELEKKQEKMKEQMEKKQEQLKKKIEKLKDKFDD
ncbi:hypothetical protein A3J43_03960 [Candidatus Uhrbacteria bacterium RIFCSPHIGHO2_12_FULL_54_23]|uniref:Fibronectin type-III domain-containing protein n=1 Tax=Candidatus Uhrbacteria bacterium RIFCSPHIGHO2_12_FULL_54_23 TaxID=1802397 RepID=A0A1F7UJP2_9BACT|nr:MAG: hypothetical protein A3J43_03960 [Candidatus Uhrbacteria bacterium RIFCSPHIGHO2_12_FULL_54_23]